MPYLSLTHAGPTLTVNKAMAGHWSQRAPVIKQWREDFAWLGLASKVRMEHAVGVEIQVFHRRETRVVGDAAGHALLAKAAIDGLVDAKVLPKDDGRWVAWIRFYAPLKDDGVPQGMVRLQVTLVDP